FWSDKGPSTDEVILEEYVDGIHFILSVGIESGFDENTVYKTSEVNKKTGEELVPYFFDVMEALHKFKIEKSNASFT
ncbi:dUTP diphosphatase, partial [Pseudomonas sp. 2822-15]|uniref:dUTP diphosphatase n=1 Tax=Pseudomonas sp. 2822-15 TaxID=1712677 RepID=UPI0015A89D13